MPYQPVPAQVDLPALEHEILDFWRDRKVFQRSLDQTQGRPEWVFVKVHTHGAPEKNAAAVFGPHAEAFHNALQRYNDGTNWRLHYVSAREMYNVAMAAMADLKGDPSQYFDYELQPPPAAS